MSVLLLSLGVTALLGLAACGGKAPPSMGPPQVTVATPLVRQITDWDEALSSRLLRNWVYKPALFLRLA